MSSEAGDATAVVDSSTVTCNPAPAYAAEAGYHTNVFSTDCHGWDISVDGGGAHDWYLTQFDDQTTPSMCVGVDAGVLTLGCGSASTAGPSDGGWTGTVFGGGAYFEATLAFNPNPDGGLSSWPAFWGEPIEHLADGQPDTKDSDRWPGQAAWYAHYCEVDFFEYNVQWADKNHCPDPTAWNGAIIDWYGIWSPDGGYPGHLNNYNGSDGHDPVNVNCAPKATDFNAFHRYGALWTPSVAGSQGSMRRYFDGVATADVVTWVGPPPATPPPSGDNIFSVIDTQHLALILDTAKGWPMQVKAVNVWQAP
jgi:hypothetical protein